MRGSAEALQAHSYGCPADTQFVHLLAPNPTMRSLRGWAE